MSRFLLVTTDTDFAARAVKAISGGLTGTLHVFETTALPETPAEMLTPSGAGPANAERTEVIILGPGVVVDDALTLAAVFDVQLPEISLVLVAEADPELALSAMRSGVRDILDPQSDSETIRVLLERACRTAANRRRVTQSASAAGIKAPAETVCNVIVVASPKGGVGKTTLATNLAVALGKLAPMSTVLVDLDAQFGDVASALQLEPEHTLTDAVSRAASQDSMVLKAYLSVHHSSIYALCAPHTPAEADRISGEDLSHLIDQLSNEFRYVVIDSAPGLGEHALAALEKATDVLLLCTMDVPSVRGLRKEMDVLDSLKLVPRNRRIVVNLSERSAGLSIKDIEATIGTKVDAVIPRVRQIAQSTDVGEPLLQQTQRGRPAKALQAIADFYDPSASLASGKGLHKRVEVQ
jgi:pilus assembly protein CpaE